MKHLHTFPPLSVSHYAQIHVFVPEFPEVFNRKRTVICKCQCSLGCSLHGVGHSDSSVAKQRERRGHLWFLSAPLRLCHSRRRVVIRDFAKSSSQQGLQENHGHRLCPRTAALGGLHRNSSNYRQKMEDCSTSDIRSHDIYSSSSFSGPAPSRHLSPMPADPCESIWKRYWLLNCFGCIVTQLTAFNDSRH